MNNLSYWEKRKAQRMFEYMQSAEDTADQIATLYIKASRQLNFDIDEVFLRYKTKFGLSDKEARRLLNTLKDKTSMDELRIALRGSGASKTAILAELESPAYRARIERLQLLQQQLDLVMKNIYKQEKDFSTRHYVQLANDSYYKSIFEIQKRIGFAFSFNTIDTKAIDTVINSKWSGKNYSKRIWSNTKALSQDIKEELLLGLVTGRSEREMANIVANKFAQGSSVARRLIRTESCYLAEQMEMKSYEECEIEYYRYLATLDLRTSDVCRSLDGKRFKVSEQQPGLNCPPMHPWCRSTTIADISNIELAHMERRARDPVTGKTYKVPASMTYQQWHEKYVNEKPEAELEEKKVKNRASDRKQYQRYSRILKKELPETLDSFQELKYNEPEKWKFVKLDYQRQDKLLQNLELKLPNAENAVLPEGKFTKYLLGGTNEKGLAKGRAFTSRLGYDINNWKELQKEIAQGATKYPAEEKGATEFGLKYEQKMILYGKKGTPANVMVGWLKKADGSMNMTSAYIKEVK